MKKNSLFVILISTIIFSACFVPIKKYEGVLTDRENIKHDLQYAQTEKNFLESQIESLQKEKVDLISKLNLFKESTAKKMSSLETEVETLRKNYEILTKEEKKKMIQIEEINSAMDKEIMQLKQENFGLLAANKAQTDRYTEVEKKNESLDQENKTKNEKIAILEKETEGNLQFKKNQEKELNELIEKIRTMTDSEEKEIVKLKVYYEQLLKEFEEEIKNENMDIIQIDAEIYIQFAENLIFDLKTGGINSDGEKKLNKLGDILKTLDSEQIKVEGHFQSWEKSIKKAAMTVKFFEEKVKINPANLQAIGLSSSRPLTENKIKNNRIELIISSKKK